MKTTRKEIGGITVDAEQPWRTENLGRLLLHAFSTFEQDVLAGLHEAGFDFARQTHLNVMRHVDREGTRMSDLATRLGITSGATTQAVELCVKEKLVELSVDPTDKRVRRVWFTRRGKRFLDVVHARWDAIEEETRQLLGDAGLNGLRRSLHRLMDRAKE